MRAPQPARRADAAARVAARSWEEGQAERKARSEARRKLEEENAPEPYADEARWRRACAMRA